MFITFEGIDGSGKSTQLDLLKNYLTEKGRSVIKLREPGGTEFSEAIRDLLLSTDYDIDALTELLLFDAARSHLVSKIIKPALKRGDVVLCDRFYDSTTAYQGYGRGLDLEKVKTINKTAAAGLIPDITFFLDVSLEVSLKRSNDRESDRIELAGNDFFTKVRDGFQQIAKSEPDRIVIINSESELYETHSKIINVLETKFPNL